MSRILLGVSASVASYKALEFVRLASAAGHAVRVIQTPTSQKFVGPSSFAAISGAPVLSDEFESDPARGAFPDQPLPEHEPISHLQLVANADLYLIAPASANTIAKLAHGLAENLLCSAALAASCPLLVAPAMNNNMYENAATRANIQLLRERGVIVIEPEVGRLASRGEQGVGRLPEPARLLEVCQALLANATVEEKHDAPGDLSGLKVLITAGGTREPIDSVRFIGNRSSGKMGFALAASAQCRGATVTLIAANVGLEPPMGVTVCHVSSAEELRRACEEEFDACDVLLMAAAVADFRPAESLNDKIKKHTREHLSIELEPTTDVLKALAARRQPGQTLIGFAAEHGDAAIDYGRQKLTAKGLDAIVVNDISRAEIGFESDHNEVTIITATGQERIAQRPKAQVAQAILDVVRQLRSERDE